MITTIKKVTNTTGATISVLCHGCGQYIPLHDGLQPLDIPHDCRGVRKALDKPIQFDAKINSART